MDEFKVGDTVQILAGPMRHSVGTVVYVYEAEKTYLVRVGASMQQYYKPDEIRLFQP
ncbi:hypothetical protein [Agrococcus casei]|uniref:hypothetical protein n=1 Tax=Agrococcus casei TaxID=343512 RepID=UPI003F8F7B25